MGRRSKIILLTTLKLSAALVGTIILLNAVFSYKALARPMLAFNHEQHPAAEIAKMSMLYGPPNPLYERALATHEAHNAKFGYPFFVLREKMLPGFWSKPAYILRILMSELEKSEHDRLKWLVWVDGDTVVMNPNIPLDIFLPPEPEWSHINAVMTNDHRGLNNGVFFLRVHPWSVWLMNACMNTPIHDPSLELEFEDQSALQYWLNTEDFRENTIHVPQRWFNAYPGFRGDPTDLVQDPLQPAYKVRKNSVKEGDFLVHHAGHKSTRAKRMWPWIEVAEQHQAPWEIALQATNYTHEIAKFWKDDAKNERKRVADVMNKVAETARKKALDRERIAVEKQQKQYQEQIQEGNYRTQQSEPEQGVETVLEDQEEMDEPDDPEEPDDGTRMMRHARRM